ncbi:MAG: alanine racemase [Deinococcota bacterium]
MAYLTLNRDKLAHNYRQFDNLFASHGINWGVVTKLLCGNNDYLREVLALNPQEVLDSRISNLARVKALNPATRTVYIKPPARRSITDVVRYADVSFNTELQTIEALSAEAVRQDKHHNIIIMMEMGDLREGVMRDDLVPFMAQVFDLPNIHVLGLGTNLNCLSGVLPNEDKLVQLGLYKTITELTYNVTIPLVSAGTSVTLPLLFEGSVPESVNHFRIGESLYFGNDLVSGEPLDTFYQDVIELHAEVIEVAKKPMVPSGKLGTNPQGKQAEVGKTRKDSTRVILDVGVLDIQPNYLTPKDSRLSIIDASSDMMVLDATTNEAGLRVGDVVSFELKYMGALQLMSSSYIDKLVIDGETAAGREVELAA